MPQSAVASLPGEMTEGGKQCSSRVCLDDEEDAARAGLILAARAFFVAEVGVERGAGFSRSKSSPAGARIRLFAIALVLAPGRKVFLRVEPSSLAGIAALIAGAALAPWSRAVVAFFRVFAESGSLLLVAAVLPLAGAERRSALARLARSRAALSDC